MRTIIDTHTHLYDLPDPLATLREAAEKGVSQLVVLGVDLASNQRHLEIKAQGTRHKAQNEFEAVLCPSIHLAFGLHPGNITTSEETEACFQFMRAHLQEAVAVGEIGLDYHYKSVKVDEAKQQEQRDVFARQLALAQEFDLPVVVHSRAAYRESLQMTRAASILKANFHWYTGPVDILKEILDAGFLVSVSPALEYSSEAQAVARYTPLDRLMIETDTPVRGWMPQDVWRTLRFLSELKGVASDQVLSVVNANAERFFGI